MFFYLCRSFKKYITRLENEKVWRCFVSRIPYLYLCVPDRRSAQCGLVGRVVCVCVPDRQSAQCGLVGRVVCVCVPDRRSAQCGLVGRAVC